MELKIYGHYGKTVLAFPCSRGRFFDMEDKNMISALQPFIDAGKIKVFAVDGIDWESWFNFSILPGDRSRRHDDYDNYLVREVIPLVHRINQNQDKVFTLGCSLGAFHSLNFFLKHPDVADGVIAMSGLYSLERKELNLSSEDMRYVYYNSPLSYLSGTRDEWFIEQYRKSTIVICCGQGRWENDCIADTLRLKEKFEEMNIPAWFDLWGNDVDHDWPWWCRQVPHIFQSLGY